MSKENPVVSIDGKKYELNAMSKAAKASLVRLKMTDDEIKRIKVQLGIAQTARASFAASLKAELK